MNILKWIGKGILGITITTCIIAGGTIIYTNPKKESFIPYFINFLKHIESYEPKGTGLLKSLVMKRGAYLLEKLCTYEITNYVVFNIAEVKIPNNDKPMYFIGVFGDWHLFLE